MKKNSFKIIVIVAVIFVAMVVGGCQDNGKEEAKAKATFIGVKDYKNATREEVLTDSNPVYQFEIDGEKKCFKVACDEDFSIQNHLMSGYEYNIVIEGDTVTSAEIANEKNIQGSVEGYTPGKRTVKNFLSAAKAPMGFTLYVYGGGWNIQDDGASVLTRRIGVSPTWKEFYDSQDEDFDFKGDTYPNNKWNTFYDKGLDCSGYLGWTLYNTLYDESETEEGIVGGAVVTLSEKYGLGTVEHPNNKDYEAIFNKMKPGDIVSTPEHVYIVVGKCDDGSAVIMHSTVTESSSGANGGGVQLSAISINGEEDLDCKAYALAKETMKTYYPEWTERYPVVLKPSDLYFDVCGNDDSVGIFSWSLGDNAFSDPEGYRDMTAEEIIDNLFN